jgi:hypothetical protein
MSAPDGQANEPIDERFHEYFAALDRSGQKDRCYLCRRTPAEVKFFFGFDEDGVPLRASEFGLEDITLEDTDIMSYRGERPVCAICQLNFDTMFAVGEHTSSSACSRRWSTTATSSGRGRRNDRRPLPPPACAG